MKRFCCMLMAVLLLCTICLTALAEGDSALISLYVAEESLLFHTDNVTMTGKAVFTLDGFEFKRAYLTQMQNGVSAVRQWVVYTPLAADPAICKPTGYTIVSAPGKITVFSSYWNSTLNYGVYEDMQKTTILRGNVTLDALLMLSEHVVEQIPEACAVETPNETGTHYTITLTADQVPVLTESTLNLLIQYGIEHYYDYWVAYDGTRITSPYGSYNTFAQEIVYGMEWIRLTSLKLEADLADDGSLLQATADVTLVMTDTAGNDHEITVAIEQTATDYGTTTIARDAQRYDRWYSTYALINNDARYEQKAREYFFAQDPVWYGEPVTEETLAGMECSLVDLTEEGHWMYVIDTHEDACWYIVMNNDEDLTFVCCELNCG